MKNIILKQYIKSFLLNEMSWGGINRIKKIMPDYDADYLNKDEWKDYQKELLKKGYELEDEGGQVSKAEKVWEKKEGEEERASSFYRQIKARVNVWPNLKVEVITCPSVYDIYPDLIKMRIKDDINFEKYPGIKLGLHTGGFRLKNVLKSYESGSYLNYDTARNGYYYLEGQEGVNSFISFLKKKFDYISKKEENVSSDIKNYFQELIEVLTEKKQNLNSNYCIFLHYGFEITGISKEKKEEKLANIDPRSAWMDIHRLFDSDLFYSVISKKLKDASSDSSFYQIHDYVLKNFEDKDQHSSKLKDIFSKDDLDFSGFPRVFKIQKRKSHHLGDFWQELVNYMMGIYAGRDEAGNIYFGLNMKKIQIEEFCKKLLLDESIDYLNDKNKMEEYLQLMKEPVELCLNILDEVWKWFENKVIIFTGNN